MEPYLLTVLIFLPLAAGLILLFVPARSEWVFKGLTVLAMSLELILATWAYFAFKTQGSPLPYGHESLQMLVKTPWISLDLGSLGSLSIEYFVGVDGLSISLLWLSGLVLFVGAIASWTIQKYVKAYFLLYLVLSASIVGCFVALDFFLFYLFFEFMLLPMFFLIGIWGGARKEYASLKFFIYTLLGSLFILVGMIALFLSTYDPVKMQAESPQSQQRALSLLEYQTGIQSGEIVPPSYTRSFNMMWMSDPHNRIPGSILDGDTEQNKTLRSFIFWALLIGFLIKLPVVPVHTWLPDAHVEAPTPVSVVLAGILLKIGGYGIIRVAYGIFPQEAASYSYILALLGAISILYGAMNALAMADLKKMIAYSSVSHMGFVLVGFASLTAEGIHGSIYQMFSHGILSSFLFLLAGVLYERTQDRQIAHYRGLWEKMPYYTFFVMVAFFASLGLPGFSGFIGEFFTLLGGFASDLVPNWIAVLATVGIVMSAAYFLWTFQKMFMGPYWVRDAEKNDGLLNDLTPREIFLLSSLSLLTFLTGIFPNLLFGPMDSTVQAFMSLFAK